MPSSEFNPYAAPNAPLTPQIVSESQGAWQDGGVMVVQNGAVLPDRCLKCNAPATGWQKNLALYWHNPAWYLLVFLGLLVYVVVAFIVRKSVRVRFSLCPTHVQARNKALIIASLLALIAIGVFFAGCGAVNNKPYPIAIFAGLALLIIAPLYGIIARRSLSPVRIDDAYGRLKGAGPEFLASLPEWGGY